MQGFNQSEQKQLGKFTIKSRFGDTENFDKFLLINAYILQSSPRQTADAQKCIRPFNIPPVVKYPLRSEQGTITADNDLFSSVEALFYKMMGNEVAKVEDVPITVLIKHPLVGFTRPMTSLEYGTIDTYHHFEVPKKGDAKNQSSFMP